MGEKETKNISNHVIFFADIDFAPIFPQNFLGQMTKQAVFQGQINKNISRSYRGK